MYVSKQVRYPWIISIPLFVEEVIFMDKYHREYCIYDVEDNKEDCDVDDDGLPGC